MPSGRRLFGETDAVVAAKTRAALRNGLMPVLCIGEPARDGVERAAVACIEQLRSALQGAADGPIIVAYEPVWAIGCAECRGPGAHPRRLLTPPQRGRLAHGPRRLSRRVRRQRRPRCARRRPTGCRRTLPRPLRARPRRAPDRGGRGRRMIGLGSYAFFWQHWEGNPRRIDLAEQLRRTRALGVDLFQVCDYAPLDAMSAGELGGRPRARRRPRHRARARHQGRRAGASRALPRSRRAARRDARAQHGPSAPDLGRPSRRRRRGSRRRCPPTPMPGVRLALETYEQVSSADLVRLVEAVAHTGARDLPRSRQHGRRARAPRGRRRPHGAVRDERACQGLPLHPPRRVGRLHPRGRAARHGPPRLRAPRRHRATRTTAASAASSSTGCRSGTPSSRRSRSRTTGPPARWQL